ncbi:putative HD superfamily hydrolase [Desulfosporosinus acidiphilus SJ4]|uniref:Putative HD superfamily hydrolase n=1 Tax=Desulfosporosinus acidiphilus (strain DSM 22704 / JCM 16185 / SJ4) TaxID=646529 RepID=I4D8F5_DESAJ|nr:HD domain-containing protein [Desulfosporosinus acidiphilus]AFM42079.1 putative HD superfamily hydrolase [Desulfosporosinus acidiphilus SJ4]
MNTEFIKKLHDIYHLLDQMELKEMERDYPILWEKVHLTSCAQIGRLLAQKRHVDSEQAALACALHDCGRWVTGRQENHAPQGEDFARHFLAQQSISPINQERIVQAIINHSKKEEVGSPLEELVKDADILDCYWYGDVISKKYHVARLQSLLSELNITSSMEG